MNGHTSTGMIGKVAQWVIAVLGIIFVVMIFSGKESGIDGGLYLTYLAFALCAGMAVLFSVYALVQAGKKAMPTLAGIGGFLVILLIAYLMSSDAVAPEWNISASTSKLIGAGLGATFVMLGGAILAIVVGEVSRLLK
jgi:hypothetical protein